MIYIYDEVKTALQNHLKDSNNKSMMLYQCTIQDLYDNYHSLTDEQKQFLYWYEYKMPVGTGPCA